MSNLDAAEVQLLNMAPATYISATCRQPMPAGRTLSTWRAKLGMKDPDLPACQDTSELTLEKKEEIAAQRGRIASAVRGASSAALREQLRVGSFRNVVVAAIVAMTLLAVGIAVMGFVRPTGCPSLLPVRERGKDDAGLPHRLDDRAGRPGPAGHRPTSTQPRGAPRGRSAFSSSR